MIVVSDTTIISSLYKIGRLDLLPAAFPKVIIPLMDLIGLISRLKKIGAIPLAKPILEELRITGFWISDALLQQVLKVEGE